MMLLISVVESKGSKLTKVERFLGAVLVTALVILGVVGPILYEMWGG